MKHWILTTLASLSFGVLILPAQASSNTELDSAPVSATPPKGLIVRTDAQGNKTLFELPTVVSNETEARAAIEAFAKTEKALTARPISELDQVSSQAAWYYGWNGLNYGYGYGFGSGYCNWYYPSYSWGSSGYNWGFWGAYTGYGWGGRGWW